MKRFIPVACTILAITTSANADERSGGGTAPTAGASSGPSQFELSLWRTPAFKQRFARSYLAVTDVEPPVTEKESVVMREVLDLMAANDLDAAIALLEKNRNAKATAAYDFMLGNLRFTRDELDLAALAYGTAAAKYPNYRRAWQQLGLARVQLGQFDKARDALVRAFELGADDAVTAGLLGFSHSNTGQWLGAETAYRRAIMLDPKTLDWQFGLAKAYFAQERFEEAAALLQTLIEGDADNADLWLIQANAFLGMDAIDRAAENFEIARGLGGATPESLSMLANIYVNQGLGDVAMDRYLEGLGVESGGDPAPAFKAARLLTRRQELEPVERMCAFMRANLMDGFTAEQKKELLKVEARVAVQRGRGDREAEILTEIVDLDPMDGEALRLLGQYYGRQDDGFEKAIFYFDRAGEIEGFEADAKVDQAQLLVRNKDYSGAIRLLKAAQAIRPRDSVQRYLDEIEAFQRNR